MNSFERKPSSYTLAAGPLELAICPSSGGSITHFDWLSGANRTHILRPSSEPKSALEASSFPLVPYVNRIRGGTFSFRGRVVELKPNMPGDPSPLHGQGWLNPWSVEHADQTSARLIYQHEASEWPWTYEARQEFALDDRGLSIILSCRNVSGEPMPCGLGQHPYFLCGGTSRLDTDVTTAWTIDEKVLPVAQVPAEGRYDLKNRSVCGQDLDNGFGGWGGEARMDDPAWPFSVRMSSPDAGFFQLYSPPSGGIFVAEPVTHANAALNAPEKDWPKLGMRVLGNGEEMRLTMRLDVSPR